MSSAAIALEEWEVQRRVSFDGVGGAKLEFIKALVVRVKLAQTEYPEIMKVGINKTGSGNFC